MLKKFSFFPTLLRTFVISLGFSSNTYSEFTDVIIWCFFLSCDGMDYFNWFLKVLNQPCILVLIDKLECSLCLCFLKHIMVSLLFNFCLLNLFISNRRVLKFQNIVLFAVLSVFSSCTLVPYCVNFKSKFNQQMDLFINSRRITIQDKQAITKP